LIPTVPRGEVARMEGAQLKIAHVDSEKGFSGGQVQVFLLMEGLERRGHHNMLFCPPGSRQERRAGELDLQVQPVAMRNDLHLTAVGRLRKGLRAFGADIVHLHTGRANWLGGLAAHLEGLPAITTRRMDHPVDKHLVNRLVYGRFVSRAVGIAPAITQHLLEGGVDASKVRTIWSTVDPVKLRPAQGRDETRSRFGVTPGTTVCLAAAQLTHRKGYDLALRAFAGLARESADVAFWIAGDGPERDALESLTVELHLTERVSFLGARQDIPDLLSAADVFIMPSRSEGLGIAALEAMAAGLPVVASRVGGLAQAVVHGETGLLFPAEDVDALRDAWRTLLEDRELRERLAAAGAVRVDENFRSDRMVADYESLYREVLAERPR